MHVVTVLRPIAALPATPLSLSPLLVHPRLSHQKAELAGSFPSLRKNHQFPNLNPQMVTLAYQRVVPATLLTQWTLATIISRKHQAVVMAVREISLTITRKKNVGEQPNVF
jgi:hypothetical protein